MRRIPVRHLLGLVLLYFMRFTLWFRYRVTIKGIENVNPKVLNKPGGVLFLPNHPTVFVDPTLVTLAIWKKYLIRPLIVEYMYYTPIVHGFMKFMRAIPIPNFVSSSNSLKKKKVDQVIETVIKDLRKKENFLIYPAGKVKNQAKEIIAASGVHRIIQAVPEANIVLVRTTGLWGSSFSRALIGKSPPMFKTIFEGVKIAFKNLIFFTPRREVIIEFMPAPADFPYQASRLELNRYLENWYNQPSRLKQNKEEGEDLYLVSYSMWREELPTIHIENKSNAQIDLAAISTDIQIKVKQKLSEITNMDPSLIKPEMNLSSDLGLDSLDVAELIAFLDNDFDLTGVPVSELTTVGKVMALASKQITFEEEVEEEESDLTRWFASSFPHKRATFPEGETIPEVFLNNCARMGHTVACGDLRSGVVTYAQAKLRVLLLTDYIKKLPGEYIGILLPSSVVTYFTILACQLAGKVPLLINWTAGARHLESVRSLSNIQVVLSSWAFLDRLDNVDLTEIEELIITLEDARREFSWKDKLKAFIRSKLKTKTLLSIFDIQSLTKDSKAVLLFTSGTESLPKGVPLTHENILNNQRDAIESVEIFQDDVLLGMLPPFHAYGFTASGLLPLLGGLRVAYYADPTDGRGLAKAIEKWAVTILCGAPTFLRGIFKNANPDQLKTLRICITGAEKAPKELFQMVGQLDHCRLIEGYGITECSPILTANTTGNPAYGVGKPMKQVSLCVVSLDQHQPLPQGEQGLVLAKGPNIFSGYLNKGISSPFITVNQEVWYSTGDLGYLDSEGNLIICGRLKRFVKIGGEMVSLTAIEEALHHTIGEKVKNEQEERPILAVIPEEEAGEKAKIFVFTSFEASVDEANKALREAGFSNLVKVFKVIQLPEIPLMGTGKINYRELKKNLETHAK